MSTENTSVETDDVNLDDFSVEFFGQKETEPVKTNTEDDSDESQERDAPEQEDTHVDESDTDEVNEEDEQSSNDDDEDETEEVVEDNKPKKNRFQERIDELNGKYREEERQRKALEDRLNEVLTRLDQNKEPEPANKAVDDKAPKYTDLNEDGTEKYPLGQFDPGFITDLTNYTLDKGTADRKAAEEAEAQQKKLDAQQTEIQTSWNEKLGPAQERYPDFREKGEQLLETFEGIDSAYGSYLENTLMSMDFGPDVLYYLANNPDEAKKIVNSGPQRATVALGRLEAKFAFADEEKQRARPKVSKAPEPPKVLAKGSAAVKAEVEDDTDDLDAFSTKLFKRK